MTSIDDVVSNLKNVVTNLSNAVITVNGFFPRVTGTTSTATAGSASLPTNPGGFIAVTLPNGMPARVPFYAPVGSASRIVLTQNTTFFVDPVNGVDSPFAGAQNNPFKHLSTAAFYIAALYDFQASQVTVQLVNGTYTIDGVTDLGFFLGNVPVGGGSFVLRGNPASPSSVILNGTASGNTGVYISQDTNYSLQVMGIQFQNFAQSAMNIQSPAGQIKPSNIIFNGGNNLCMQCEGGGFYEFEGPITYNGANGQGVYCNNNGNVDYNGAAVTFGAGSSFSFAFLNCENGGGIQFGVGSITGTTSGQRFNIDSGATIHANIGSTLLTESQIPGSTAGVNQGGSFNNDYRASSFGYDLGNNNGTAVTQATGKGTGVTVNTICGQITTHSSSLAANTATSFLVTNSSVATTDTVILGISSGASTAYLVGVNGLGVGSFTAVLRNASVASASDALVLNFSVFKSANN